MKRFMSAKFFGLGMLVVLLVVSATGLTGCGDSTTDSTTTSAFEGTWTLYEGTAIQGSPYWYANFKADKTFFISDNANGTAVRVSGTWTESGGTLVGPFTNPGVGNGRVEATITNNVMQMDFIEYWHTPNKHVPYAGTKI
jgi:hypothetical protein